MKLGIIITQTEPETVFNTLRLALYSLQQGDQVRIFPSFYPAKEWNSTRLKTRRSTSGIRRKRYSTREVNSLRVELV
jgi:hypothetical protein